MRDMISFLCPTRLHSAIFVAVLACAQGFRSFSIEQFRSLLLRKTHFANKRIANTELFSRSSDLTNPVRDSREQLARLVTGSSFAYSLLIGSSAKRASAAAAATAEKNRQTDTSRTVFRAIPDDCSDSVTLLKGEGTENKGREVILIGTAHISETSVELVQRIIRSTRPDTVMIELDAKRIGKITDSKRLADAGFYLPMQAQVAALGGSEGAKSDNQPLAALGSMIIGWAKASLGAALGKALSSFYKSVEKLGFVAGGEFKAAVEEARAIGAKVLLGDRDIDITLSRLAAALSSSSPESFTEVERQLELLERENGIVMNENIDREKLSSMVESLKQKDLLTSLMKVLKAELPLVYQALIGERDIYMAESISGSSDSGLLVAVVGMAHMQGIETRLSERQFGILKRNCPTL